MSHNKQTLSRNLAQLIVLREQEMDQHQAGVARQRELVARYQKVVDRLDQVTSQLGASAHVVPSLAINCGQYKQAMLEWGVQQRHQLASHEADLVAQQAALMAVARKQEALGQLQRSVTQRLLTERLRREQKQQDELANQLWQRK
jgi:flagellar export protein FliJ